MKKIIPTMTFIVLLTFYLTACKKSTTDRPQTTMEKVQGKWLLQSEVVNNHNSGLDHITTVTGTPTDVLDFRNDGKVYVDMSGIKDTSTYFILGDTKIVLNGNEIFNIKTLTSSSFIIYEKQVNGGSGDYDESTISMNR